MITSTTSSCARHAPITRAVTASSDGPLPSAAAADATPDAAASNTDSASVTARSRPTRANTSTANTTTSVAAHGRTRDRSSPTAGRLPVDSHGTGRRDLAKVRFVPRQPTDPTPPMPAGPKRFLTLDQVSEELNVSHSQVYALVRDRSIIAVKIGGRGQWRVERAQLEAYTARLYEEAKSRDPEDLPDVVDDEG